MSGTRRNPGWAGETGDYAGLSEDDVRGTAYIGRRPMDGGTPGAAPSYPFQIADRDPDAPLFEGPYRERFEKILSRYPNKQGALLPVLNMAHEVRGHLAPETMDRVASLLDLSPAYVRGVATFYTMYSKRPVGRFLIQVCTNVCCNLCGADRVTERFLDEVGAEMGEVSEDGLFTVVEAECLGACGFPTVVQINNRYFENVLEEDVPAILEELRERGVPAPQTAAESSPRSDDSGRAAGGTSHPEAREEQAPQPTVQREPAVPPTPEGASAGGPAGPRVTRGSEAHRPEDVGEGEAD